MGVDNIFIVGGGGGGGGLYCHAHFSDHSHLLLDCQAHPFCQK